MGPLADMVAAEHRSSLAVGPASVANASRVVLSEGRAIQNPDERGSMMLHRAGSGTSTPFRVIALEGGLSPGMGEYPLLLIFTCDVAAAATSADGAAAAAAAGEPLSELVLLSRSPTVAPQTVFLLLSSANLQGLVPDCDNPFVPSVQRPDNCAAAAAATAG